MWVRIGVRVEIWMRGRIGMEAGRRGWLEGGRGILFWRHRLLEGVSARVQARYERGKERTLVSPSDALTLLLLGTLLRYLDSIKKLDNTSRSNFSKRLFIIKFINHRPT